MYIKKKEITKEISKINYILFILIIMNLVKLYLIIVNLLIIIFY
jgi:hypothetical protein